MNTVLKLIDLRLIHNTRDYMRWYMLCDIDYNDYGYEWHINL